MSRKPSGCSSCSFGRPAEFKSQENGQFPHLFHSSPQLLKCGHLSLRFYEDKQVGNLMPNVINDTDLFKQFIAHAIPDVVINLITLIGVTAVLF
jgi:ABC-type multidrug transport system fused ATPase/permease subunit